MALKQGEEANKDRLMKIAENELRYIGKEETKRVATWWDKHRTDVGWKRLARVLTTYGKEFRIPYTKDDAESKIPEELADINGDWAIDIKDQEKIIKAVTNSNELTISKPKLTNTMRITKNGSE